MASHRKGCACGSHGTPSSPPPMSRQYAPAAPISSPPTDTPRPSRLGNKFGPGQGPGVPGQVPGGAGKPCGGSGQLSGEPEQLSLNCNVPSASDDPEKESTARQRAERQQQQQEREAKEAELRRWVSDLRQFDSFAMAEMKRRDQEEEDFPKLKVPQLKGHHRCKVSCLLNHQVDYAMDMERDLRNIGIQETQMLDMLDKLTRGEAAVRFQGAVRAAEVAAMSAPPELAEEAAVAGARGYTVEVQEISKSGGGKSDNPIEIVGYIGCTRPT